MSFGEEKARKRRALGMTVEDILRELDDAESERPGRHDPRHYEPPAPYTAEQIYGDADTLSLSFMTANEQHTFVDTNTTTGSFCCRCISGQIVIPLGHQTWPARKTIKGLSNGGTISFFFYPFTLPFPILCVNYTSLFFNCCFCF